VSECVRCRHDHQASIKGAVSLRCDVNVSRHEGQYQACGCDNYGTREAYDNFVSTLPERAEGAIIPQGLSITHTPSGYYIRLRN
jgi:hypothetical protein